MMSQNTRQQICTDSNFLFNPAIPGSEKFAACKAWLLKWGESNLPALRGLEFASPLRPESLTLIAYCFHTDETCFERVELGILQTWRCLGKYPLVIVADRLTDTLSRFNSQHRDACKIIISPTLQAGNPSSMNLDCIVNLYKYFSTPYCLIIQDDGFPIQAGIEKFLGRWDYVGAPFVRDKPWQFLADWLLINIENGGFCLRSHRICSATSQRYDALRDSLSESELRLEDWFYCHRARKNLIHRFRYRFAPAREARRFSFIDVEGLIDRHTLTAKPLGIHGPTTIWQFQDVLADDFGYTKVPMNEVLAQ